MTTAKEVLIKARELITEPEHWCKGWYAKEKSDMEITAAESPNAFMFCSLGAIRKVMAADMGSEFSTEYINVRDEAVAALAACEDPDYDVAIPEETVVNFNDTKDHEAVIGAFDCAISKL